MLIDCLLGLSLVGVLGLFVVPRRIVTQQRLEPVTREDLIGLFPDLDGPENSTAPTANGLALSIRQAPPPPRRSSSQA